MKLIAFAFIEDFTKISLHPSHAKEKLKKLQGFCLKLRSNKIDDNKIESIYIEAVEQLTGSSAYIKSEAILNSGLEILPQSARLKKKLNEVSILKKNSNSSVRYSSAVFSRGSVIKPPPYNDTEVYNSVKKHMLKCWNVALIEKIGQTKDENSEQLNFTFLADGKVKIKGGGEENWGTWNLSTSGPVLTLKSPRDELQFSILIYECNANLMRGIISPYKIENVRIEFNPCEQ